MTKIFDTIYPFPQIRNRWLEKKHLVTTNGKGRGMDKKEDDGPTNTLPRE